MIDVHAADPHQASRDAAHGVDRPARVLLGERAHIEHDLRREFPKLRYELGHPLPLTVDVPHSAREISLGAAAMKDRDLRARHD